MFYSKPCMHFKLMKQLILVSSNTVFISTHDPLKKGFTPFSFLYVGACVCKPAHCERFFLVPPPQQEHKEDGTEQNRECAHSGNNDLSYHLHMAGQRICKAYTKHSNSSQ